MQQNQVRSRKGRILLCIIRKNIKMLLSILLFVTAGIVYCAGLAEASVPDYVAEVNEKELSQVSSETINENTPALLVNINTAGAEELTKLKGIGKKRAEDIIAYRALHGGFGSKEELMLVPGIKEGIYSKICGEITVE